MDLCSEIRIARKEAGLSQDQLAKQLGVPRLRMARMESGVGSVDLLVNAMSAISLRLTNVAKGETIVVQLQNARLRNDWSIDECADRAGVDARTIRAVEVGRGTLASLMAMLTVLAPKARKQPISRAFWNYDRSRTAEADSRFTPMAFLDHIVAAFGEIHLDPCCHSEAPIKARRKIILPEDGLVADWTSDGLVWINPPFSDLAPWLERANEAWATGEVQKMIFLLPASRMDLKTYFEVASKEAVSLILRERLQFASVEHPSGKYRAPFALSLIVWGCGDEEIERFRRLVSSLRYGPLKDS